MKIHNIDSIEHVEHAYPHDFIERIWEERNDQRVFICPFDNQTYLVDVTNNGVVHQSKYKCPVCGFVAIFERIHE